MSPREADKIQQNSHEREELAVQWLTRRLKSFHGKVGKRFEGRTIVDCLEQMHNKYPNSSGWPNNDQQLQTFLVGSVNSPGQAKSPLTSWYKSKAGASNKKIAELLRKELVKCRLLKIEKPNFMSWDKDCIETVLAILLQRKQDRSATDLPIQEEDLKSINRGHNIPGVKSNLKKIASNVHLIETLKHLENIKSNFPFAPLGTEETRNETSIELESTAAVAVHCEGVPDSLHLINVGTSCQCYIFDCVKLGEKVVCNFLHSMLSSDAIVKVFHDLHQDSFAFSSIGGVDVKAAFDTQLAAETLTGDIHTGLNKMLELAKVSAHTGKKVMKEELRKHGRDLFAKRPLSKDALEHTAADVMVLMMAYQSLRENSADKSKWMTVQRASDVRAAAAARNGGNRSICFDVESNYRIASLELMHEGNPSHILQQEPLVVSNETNTLLAMLPEDLQDDLSGMVDKLSEVALDKGRHPHAWVAGKRIFLTGPQRIVQQKEIDAVVDKLGGFGSDNRAGLERQLHRISAMRNRDNKIVGLTMRVGRHKSGNTGMIADLLFADTTKSILFLGEPGSGKTTAVREATRLLAERVNVCIVDTSNEIAGDGDIPHPCVGHARRMMVPSLDAQGAIMVECVQNHTPEVMVIDEIGRSSEVEAARTCKNRGVRMLASAHGDLRGLIKNAQLRGLVGGVTSVTLGDVQAKDEAEKSGGGKVRKTKAERAGPPTFEIIVEMRRGVHHEWRVVLDAGQAVDRVLAGEEYFAQLRIRDASTGGTHLKLIEA